MNILVCISKSPDTTSKIAFTDGNTKFDENGVQFIVNPYDEWYALVRALEIKEKQGGNVTIITVGTSQDEAIIRKALAIGADGAVRIDAEPTDAYNVASQIASYAKENNFDLILTGKETLDYNGSEVGAMIAEMLDLPFVGIANKLDLEGNTLKLEQEISGGVQVLSVNYPAVISCSKGMAEQRIPNMRGIMEARKKPLTVKPSYTSESFTNYVSFTLPEAKKSCTMISPDNVEELVNLLHTEAKVI